MLDDCGSCGLPVRWYATDPVHEGQYAALREGRVVAHEGSLAGLVASIQERGWDARQLVIEHLGRRATRRVF